MNIQKEAIRLYENGEIEKAIKICKANLNNKKYSDLYRLLSTFLFISKNYTEALSVIDLGLSSNKKNKFLYLIKGNIYNEMKLIEKAIINYKINYFKLLICHTS